MASASRGLRHALFRVCVCLCCCYDVVSGMSGAFYADNMREQSVLYKPLANRQKHELQLEILHLFGLQHRPRPRNHDTHSSAPQYLLDLYREFETEEDPLLRKNAHARLASINTTESIRRTISDSDVIVSFVNRIHHKSPNLRHDGDKTFWFDISDVPPDGELVAAELRLFRDPARVDEHSYQLDLYDAVVDGGQNFLKPIDVRIISKHDTGWLTLNVTGSVMYWVAFPEKNNGLHLKIKAVGASRSFAPDEIGLIGSKGPEEYRPFMVAYFKTATQLHIRKPRAARKRHHESYHDQHAWNPYTNSLTDTYPSRRTCQRWTLYVSFRDLGWQDWIIAPDGYGAFYCSGECSFPLNAHMNATNHAIVQTLVHLMDPSVVPKPCCAPTQLSAITVLYFDDHANVILKKYRNMIVKSCGCH